MRKILFVAILIGLLCLAGDNARADGTGASGNEVGWQVITTTGITVIEFDRITNEIYTVNYTTQPAYVNWVSTTPVSTNFLLTGYMEDFNQGTVVRGASRTEEIQSSNMSIDAGATPPVHIRLHWKYWRQ